MWYFPKQSQIKIQTETDEKTDFRAGKALRFRHGPKQLQYITTLPATPPLKLL